MTRTSLSMGSGASAGGDTARPDNGLFGLIRYSHIFSSAIREVLELRLLQEVGAEQLSLPQFHLLQLITLNGTHQIGQVANFLGVSPPAATKNIDKLERLGLVARNPCEGDRRAILVSSSKEGHRLVERYESVKQERLAPVLENFSAAELSEFGRLLQRFSLALIGSSEDCDGLCLRCSAYFDDSCPIQHLHTGCPYQKIRADKHHEPAEAET